MSSNLKSWRSKLRREYYNKYTTDTERIANAPPFVKLEQWREFVENEGTEVAKKRSELGKTNRSKIGATHTSGRNGQAQVRHILKKQRLDKPNPDPYSNPDSSPNPNNDTNVTRVDVWIASHTRDGIAPASLAKVVEQVITKDRELKESGVDQSKSLTADALSQVFGIDKRGRTRGVGSTMSLSSIKASMPAFSLLREEKAENQNVKGRMKTMEKSIKGMESMLSDLYTMVKSNMGKSQSMPTDGGNAIHGASSSSNVERHLLDDGVSCEIKCFNGMVIAKGRIDATPHEKVHGYTIDYKEEVVVIVDNILDSNAEIYLGRQVWLRILETLVLGVG